MMTTKKEISGGVVHDLPPDMQKALASDPKSLAAWENITPLARNEWICWVTIVKKADKRKEHITRMLTELKENVRRPCCWPGCPHRRPKAQKWFSKRTIK
jgi:uncharacterized protein YdeI (YjbR/CyaY-like superfamily)